MSGKNKVRRERKWAEDPRCRRCGIVTIPPEEIESDWQLPRMATLEHVDTRMNPMRGCAGHDVVRTSLLCRDCNQKVATYEQKVRGL